MSGPGQGTWKLRGSPLGNGNPTQMLNSDVAQQASGVLEGPEPVSHVSGEAGRVEGTVVEARALE